MKALIFWVVVFWLVVFFLRARRKTKGDNTVKKQEGISGGAVTPISRNLDTPSAKKIISPPTSNVGATPNQKSPPSVRENVAPKTGSGTGRWRDPIYKGEQDFAEIAMLLELRPGASARTLVGIARNSLGPGFDKHRINSAIYRMWHRGLVEKKMVGKVPYWYLS
jgi:hypothetical protein